MDTASNGPSPQLDNIYVGASPQWTLIVIRNPEITPIKIHLDTAKACFSSQDFVAGTFNFNQSCRWCSGLHSKVS
jgi:hypothetical protein